MKKSLLLLPLMALALASCDSIVVPKPSPSTPDPSSTTSSVDPSSTTSSSVPGATNWSSELLAAIESELMGVELPFIELPNYSFSNEEGVVYIDNVGEVDYNDVYRPIMEEAGWAVDDSMFETYGAYVFTKDIDETYYVEVETFWAPSGTYSDGEPYEAGYCIYAYLRGGYSYVNGFPADVIAYFAYQLEVEISIPSIAITSTWGYKIQQFEENQFELNLITEDPEVALEVEYKAIFETAGHTVDDSMYAYYGYGVTLPSEDAEIGVWFYSYEGVFHVDVCVMFTESSVEPEVSTGFPSDVIASFLTSVGSSAVVPGIDDTTGEWKYASNETRLAISTSDSGTPGSDALEDVYKAVLEEAHWVIDDTAHDSYGYFATHESYPEIELSFYTYLGKFVLTIAKLEVADVDTCVGFPSEAIATYLTSFGSTSVVPAFEDSTATWTYGVDPYYGDFCVATENTGEIGVDSLEDQYKDILEAAGWTVDGSRYEAMGYMAMSDEASDVVLVFYIESGLFCLFVTYIGS